jgi:hypothetical protein
MPIEFPFAEVSELELAFPIVPNYDEVIAAVPEEFSDDQRLFLSAAEKWFAGTFDITKDLPGYKVKTRDVDDAIQQRDYIRVWAETYQPKHEQKIQVIGWLLSLAFEKTE